jgi:hypothetical protein
MSSSSSQDKSKPLVPLWILTLVNPIVSALLRSPLHGLMSRILMVITYRGRKSGKVISHPLGYFKWDQDEVMAFTSARWWVNMLDGQPVTLLVKGQPIQARPTPIHEREAVINTLEEFKKRLGTDAVRGLPIGLPKDREPTRADLEAAPAGIALVHFKFLSHSQGQ